MIIRFTQSEGAYPVEVHVPYKDLNAVKTTAHVYARILAYADYKYCEIIKRRVEVHAFIIESPPQV